MDEKNLNLEGAQSVQKNSEPEDIFAETDHSTQNVEIPQNEVNQEPVAQVSYNQSSSASPVKKIVVIIVFTLVIAGIGYGMFWYYNQILAQQLQESLNPKNTKQQEVIKVDGATEQVEASKEQKTNDAKADIERILEQQKVEEAKAKARLEAEEKEAKEEEVVVDTDNDGLSDEEEKKYGTNPESLDTDGDGLFDKEEIIKYKTDPLDSDTDGDGFLDGVEVDGGYNPNGEGKIDFNIPSNN